MLHYAIVFFLVALVAAFFGFGGISSDAAWIAKVLFVVFLIMALVSLVFGRRRPALCWCSEPDGSTFALARPRPDVAGRAKLHDHQEEARDD
jgi:uncharacterized membrane protein YtjA (UPF0391 family)